MNLVGTLMWSKWNIHKIFQKRLEKKLTKNWEFYEKNSFLQNPLSFFGVTKKLSNVDT